MIDDSQFAMVIFGIKFAPDTGNATLSIGDPHINQMDVDSEVSRRAGIYDVNLTNNGEQISNTISKEV
jgi:hypothetical protein